MALNFVTFNQDHSVLGIATSSGFQQFYTEPFSTLYKSNDGDVSLMEMLFSTSLVALILSPRLLRIVNTKRNCTIVELTFPQRVLAIRMNRRRLIVVTEGEIYLYDMSNMKMLHTIEMSPNPNAICALSPSSDSNYLIYPLPQKAAPSAFTPPSHIPPAGIHVAPTSGSLLIFDATKLEAINVIEAHQTPISFISINNTGTLIATASEKGTIIRVFSIPDGQKLFQFRRGSIPARIFSMSFNETSTLLAVSSATETVHIFKLTTPSPGSPKPSDSGAPESPTQRESSFDSRDRSISPAGSSPPADDESSSYGESSIAPSNPGADRRPITPGFASMLRRTSQNVGMSLATKVGGYLPKGVTEMWEPARDFAWVKAPKPSNSTGVSTGPMRTVVAMSSNHPQVMVVTSEGTLAIYGIDLEKGGEGVLEVQYS
ncbi:hypothetical protein K402DRAFT_324009 [Aulographum hederae CBS 113979]|uniref:WD40 repeat-like protein n=1 Tax=Aulographum hederae CBS 113979 TaxID=1176131 RepID=A0A6G1HCX4_9PEZI|nr:hypothetical protein K402DRAFT_324009 [Aulographum hederae CBS 113979]